MREKDSGWGGDLPDELRAWREAGEYLALGRDARRIFTRSVGSAEAAPERTLLALHGFPESSFSFHRNLDALAAFFDRVVLFDFLGFGLSDKPSGHDYSLSEQADIALSVWTHHGVRGGHLLAHDMGDSVATELLARAGTDSLPETFDGGFVSLTLTDGSMVLEMARLRTTQRLLLMPGMGRLLSRLLGYTTFRHQVRSASGAEELLAERDIESMWAALRHDGGHRLGYRLIRYLEERKRLEKTRWLPALAGATLPIHLCWGALDRVASLEIAEYLRAHVCRGARLTVLPRAGHFCQMEDPDGWNEAVIGFWRSLETGA
jgi:pimeloyl-ACP methyl ester carboxylesterase